MSDSAYTIDNIYRECEKILRMEFQQEEDLRQYCFNYLMNEYRGFDIIEVVCREAAYFLIYDNLSTIFSLRKMFSQREFLTALKRTAGKYAKSENWPGVEIQKAKAFQQYVCSLRS